MSIHHAAGHESAEIFSASKDVPEELRAFGRRVARSGEAILLLGERGSGKTLAAERIHRLSGREGPFVPAAASHIPEHMEYAYFAGYAKGAFTGAFDDRPGVLEAAHGGTLFLDELALAPAKVQEVLLTLLTDGVVIRMGETRRRPVDVRFIAATNADLDAMAAARDFRQDLLDRFGYLRFNVRALRDRRGEILDLATEFLLAEAARLNWREVPCLSPEVQELLLTAPWRGNIRNLEDAITFAVLKCGEGPLIDVYHLPLTLLNEIGPAGRKAFDEAEPRRIEAALERAGGNVTEAARMLGMSRRHLHRLLRKKAGGETA